MSSVEIRTVDKADVWPIRQVVMYPNLSIEEVKLSSDYLGLHLGLFKNDKIIGVISLFFKDNDLQFRKLAVLKQEQGLGYGSKLLKQVFEIALARNAERIWCNARVDKISFYENFGMIETDMRFIKYDIDFVVMEKVLKS